MGLLAKWNTYFLSLLLHRNYMLPYFIDQENRNVLFTMREFTKHAGNDSLIEVVIQWWTRGFYELNYAKRAPKVSI